jgi:hypothetical protein
MMAQRLLTRRQAMAAGVGVIVAGLSGCGSAPAIVRAIVLRSAQVREWTKVVRIIADVIHSIAVLIGWMDGKEVKVEVSLTKEELEAIRKGAVVEVETKNGRHTIKPMLRD